MIARQSNKKATEAAHSWQVIRERRYAAILRVLTSRLTHGFANASSATAGTRARFTVIGLTPRSAGIAVR